MDQSLQEAAEELLNAKQPPLLRLMLAAASLISADPQVDCESSQRKSWPASIRLSRQQLQTIAFNFEGLQWVYITGRQAGGRLQGGCT